MFLQLLRFEWRYHTRRWSFLLAAALFFLFGFLLAASPYTAPEVHLNAPYVVTQGLGLLSLGSIFVMMLFAAASLLRDGEYRMTEVVYATAVTKGHYLLGRYLGAVSVAAIAMAAAVPGMLLGTWVVPHEADLLGPFRLLDYLQPFALLVMPNILFVGAVLFAVAAWSRNRVATYVSGVLLYLLYFAAAMLTDSPLMAQASPITPDRLAAVALADPFGLSAFFEQTHYWSAAERNAQRLVVEGGVLWNRLLWMGLSAMLLIVVYRTFHFRLPNQGATLGILGKGDKVGGTLLADKVGGTLLEERKVGGTWVGAAPGWFGVGGALVRLEGRQLVRGWAFPVLVVLWVGILGMEMFQHFRMAEFGTVLVPTGGLLLGVLGEPLRILGTLVLLFFTAEVVWRERTEGVAELVDVTPVSNGTLMAAKAAVLAGLAFVLCGIGVVLGWGFQLATGTALTVGPLLALIALAGLPLLLHGALFFMAQVVAPHRYVGMLLGLGAFLLGSTGLAGISHPLLRYAHLPAVPHSDLGGFSPAWVSFSWFGLYWGFAAGGLLLLSLLLWRRGTEDHWRIRWRRLPQRWRRWPSALRRSVAWAPPLFAVVAVALWFQTHRINAYETAEEVRDFRAAYERQYAFLKGEPQPVITEIEMEVALFPRERRYEMAGRLTLENRSGEAVTGVWLTFRRDLTSIVATLVDGAEGELNREFRTYHFPLTEPLAVGKSTAVDFEIEVHRWGASVDGADHAVVENGSFLLSPFFLPTVGYRLGYELRDPRERQRRGLGERAEGNLAAIDAVAVEEGGLARAVLDIRISTDGDQTALAPGRLVNRSTAGGRNTFHYRTDVPVTPWFALVSGRYTARREEWGGVAVELYHHPGHGENAPRFLKAAKAALEYCTENFGPYPHGELRLVEIPAFWNGFAGVAAPGLIPIVEDRGFLTDFSSSSEGPDEGRIDLVSKRVAHEVAHQWWGHQLTPADAPGASALVETPARYTELMVLKEMYGEGAISPVLEVEMDRYLAGRTRGAEVPLAEVQGEAYLFYAKGAVTMMALRDLLGEAAVNRAWASLLAPQWQSDRPAGVEDFLDALHREATAEQRELIDQWWRRIMLYDLAVEEAVVAPREDGRFEVRVEIHARKAAVEGGEATPMPFAEDLQLALYRRHPAGQGGKGNLLGKKSLSVEPTGVAGIHAVQWVVEEPPGFVVIDPDLRRIDRHRGDNLRKVLRGEAPHGGPGK